MGRRYADPKSNPPLRLATSQRFHPGSEGLIRRDRQIKAFAQTVRVEPQQSSVAADNRPSLVTACKALDRVIRSGRYWIPHWYKASHWLAYWDVFGRPATKPRYARGIPETWWYDGDKAARLEQRG